MTEKKEYLMEVYQNLSDWLDEMKEIQKPSGFWTKARCSEEAKKYERRSEFKKKAGSAYNIASKNKWLDNICSHM